MLRHQTQIPRAFVQLRLAFMRTPTPRKQNEQHLLLANGYCPAYAVSRLASLLAWSVVIGTNITDTRNQNEQHLLLLNASGRTPAHAVLRLGSLLACSVVIGTNTTEARKENEQHLLLFHGSGWSPP